MINRQLALHAKVIDVVRTKQGGLTAKSKHVLSWYTALRLCVDSMYFSTLELSPVKMDCSQNQSDIMMATQPRQLIAIPKVMN